MINKSGRKQSDADCLSHTPIDSPSLDDQDEDTFLGAISADKFAKRQLRSLAEHLEGKTDCRRFKRGLSLFYLRNDVLVNNFSPVECQVNSAMGVLRNSKRIQ